MPYRTVLSPEWHGLGTVEGPRIPPLSHIKPRAKGPGVVCSPGRALIIHSPALLSFRSCCSIRPTPPTHQGPQRSTQGRLTARHNWQYAPQSSATHPQSISRQAQNAHQRARQASPRWPRLAPISDPLPFSVLRPLLAPRQGQQRRHTHVTYSAPRTKVRPRLSRTASRRRRNMRESGMAGSGEPCMSSKVRGLRLQIECEDLLVWLDGAHGGALGAAQVPVWVWVRRHRLCCFCFCCHRRGWSSRLLSCARRRIAHGDGG